MRHRKPVQLDRCLIVACIQMKRNLGKWGTGGAISITQDMRKMKNSEGIKIIFGWNEKVLEMRKKLVKKRIKGFPWWRSGWESACQCRGHGFEPWSGKIPHATEQLGPWATIAEPARLEPVLHNKGGRDSERPAHRDEEWPPLATTRERPRTETKNQHSHK